MNKQNDWFAANLNKPDFGLDEMFAAGITPDNTTLHDKDYYKNIKQVKDTFTDKNTGKFNEEWFDEYYNGLSRSYNEFSRTDFANNWLKAMESSPYDIFSLDNPNTFDATVKMVRNSDPQRHQIGVSGINRVGAPSWDEREVAQANFVRDANGKKLNWTPNQKGFFGALTGETLVKATYDKDGYYEENGKKVFHRKGEAKYDENGDPYYELLGNRSIYGKDVLHVTDVITDDDNWTNSFDFLDSDSLDKSIGKTIAKTIAQIGIYAIPYVGPYLGAVKAVMDMSSVLPIVGKAADGILTGTSENPFGKSMSKWEGIMARFDKSQTQYAKEHQWSFENIGDMLGNSAGQLYSQRLIGQIPMLFKNTNNIGDLQKIGQKVSLGYMALTSAEDSYKSFKDAGANDTVAGAGFLLTAASLYGLMSQDYFKEWLFKDSNLGFDPEMRFAVREFADTKGKEIIKNLGISSAKPTSNEVNTAFIKKLWISLKDFTTKYADKIPTGKAYPTTLVYANRALNEGIEEVMEETVGDMIKGIALGAEALGFKSSDQEGGLDFGFSPEEMVNRYLTSFVGGALGGSVFEGMTRWENYWRNDFGKIDNLLDTPAKRRILWYLSNGYGNELRAALKQEYNKGHLGDKNLTFDGELTTDASGKNVWTFKTAENGNSQNDQMYKILSKMIDTIEYQAGSLRLLTSDSRILEAAKRTDDVLRLAEANIEAAAKKEGLTVDEYKRRHRTSLMERAIVESAADEAIFSDVWTLKNRIIKLQENIDAKEALLREGQTDSNRTQFDARVEQDEDIKFWKSEQKKALNEYNEILNGEKTSEYIGLAAFTHNNFLRNIYLRDSENSDVVKPLSDKRQYARAKYNQNYDALSESGKEFINKEYGESIALQTQPIIREAYNLHRRLIERMDPVLKSIKEDLDGFIMDPALEDSTLYEFYKSWIPQAQEVIGREQAELDTISDKSSTRATQLQRHINKLKSNIDGMQKLLEQKNASLVTRAISSSDDAESFAEGLPNIFTQNPDISDLDVDDTLNLLESYFNYLKDNKIIEGYTSPIFNNVLNNILKAFKLNVTELVESYKEAHLAEENVSRIAEAIKNIRYDYETGEIVDRLAEIYGSVNRAEEAARSVNLLEIYKAKRLRAILNKQELKKELTEDELAYLTINTDIDVDSIVDVDGNVKDPTFDKLADPESEKEFSSATTNFFAEGSPQLEMFMEAVDKFINDVKRDPSKFGEYLDTLKNTILPKIINPTYRAQIENNLFGMLNNVSEKLNNILQIVSELKKSPITALLDHITLSVGGEHQAVLDYLQDEYKGLKSQADLNEYVITNPSIRTQLESIRNYLPVIQALIASTQEGSFNDTINTYRTKDNDETFVVLDDQQITIHTRELNYIKSRIDTLLGISDSNTQSNAAEQVDVQINMRPKYMRRFIGNPNEPNLVKAIFDEFQIDTNDLWVKAIANTEVDANNVNRENYKSYFEAVMRWENAVYAEFAEKTKTLTQDQIGEKIGKCFTALENNSGTYDSDENTNPTDLAIALYFMSVIGYKPSDYHGLYKQKCLDRANDYPFDNQEMAIRMGFVASQNIAMYNAIIKQIKVDNPNKNSYISEMSILKNLLAILGANGTGKSKIVSKGIVDLLKATGKTFDIIATTAYSDRLNEMKIELGITSDSKTILISNLINQINGRAFNPDDYKSSKDGHPCKLSDDVLSKLNLSNFQKLFADANIKVLALDEGTFASEAELQALCEVASKSGVFILLTGDLNQQYAMRQYKNADDELVIDSSGLEDCIYGATPMLSTSMRASNEGMRTNARFFNKELNTAVQRAKANPELGSGEIITSSNQPINIDLQYHETPILFAGSRVITSEDVAEYVRKFDKFSQGNSKKPNVVIISDSDKYEALANENIVIVKPEQVQGREFEYAVIDIDLSNPIYNANFAKLKAINTWLSRARTGSVIVGKLQMSENGFIITSTTDMPRAAATIDTKRDKPEELAAYKDFVDDVYSTVTTPSVQPTPAPTPGSKQDESPAPTPGKANRYITGAHATDNGDVDEEIATVIQEVLDGRPNSDGYEDEDNYRKHKALLNSENYTPGFYSLESFYNWLNSEEGESIIFGNFKGNIFPSDITNAQKAQYKRFIQAVVYAVVSNSRFGDSTSADVLNAKRDNLIELLKGIDANAETVVDALINALSEKNNAFGVFKTDPNDDMRTSLIWFVFGNEDHTFAIPMGNANVAGNSRIYSNIEFSQDIPLSIISSKGRIHLPISRYSSKLHLNGYGGIFAPTTTPDMFSENMSDAAKNFYNSKGRFYNIWDLNVESQSDRKTAEDFFTSSRDNNKQLLDFTQSEGKGTSTRIKGTHKIVDFSKYIILEKAVQRLIRASENGISNDDIKLLQDEFELTENEIEILRSGANYYSGSDNVAYNAEKRNVLRKTNLLNWISRGNLSSALLRLSMDWWANESQDKQDFSSSFLSNFINHFLIESSEYKSSKTYANDEGSVYTNGFTLTFTGNDEYGHRRRGSLFVSINSNSEFVLEAANNRLANTSTWTLPTGLKANDYLDKDFGYNIKRLTRDILVLLRSNDYLKQLSISHNENPFLAEISRLQNTDSDLDYIDSIFSDGTIAILPSKRYDKVAKGSEPAQIKYFNVFDSELAAMVPDTESVYSQVDQALHQDPVFKYGMYAVEIFNEDSEKDDKRDSEFSIKNLELNDHLTDIADIMLPAYNVQFNGFDEETDDNIIQKVNELGKFRILKSDTSSIATFKSTNDSIEIRIKPVINVNKVDLSQIVKSNDKLTEILQGAPTIDISGFTILNGNVKLLLSNGVVYNIGIVNLDSIKAWLKNMQIEYNDPTEIPITTNEDGFTLRWNNGRLSVFNTNTSKNPNLIVYGVRHISDGLQLFVNSDFGITSFYISDKQLSELPSNIKSSLSKLIEDANEFGEYVYKDEFGTYFYNGSEITYLEDGTTSPITNVIVSISNNEILFANGTSLRAEDDRDFFNAIRQTVSSPIAETNTSVIKLDKTYLIHGVSISSDWIASNCNQNNQILTSDMPVLLEINDKSITVSDGENVVKFILNNNGKQWIETWLKGVNVKNGKDSISNILNDSRLNLIRERLINIAVDNPSNFIELANKLFVDSANILGIVYHLNDMFELYQDNSDEAKSLLIMHKELKKLNIPYTVVYDKKIGNSHKFTVSLQTESGNEIQEWNVENFKAFKVESSNTEIENQIRNEINNIVDEDTKRNLNRYLNVHLLNEPMSDELTMWLMVNFSTYQNLINRIDKLSKKAC